MKLGVVMGDIALANPKKDTTLGLLDAAQRRGHDLSYFTLADIGLRDGEVFGMAKALSIKDEYRPKLGCAEFVPMASLDAIFIRVDPPVDENYIAMCQMLEMVEGPCVFNRPASIRMANEKMFAQRFASFQPATLFSAAQDKIHEFIREQKEAVIKPLNGLQGESVFRASTDDVNVDTVVEVATNKGRRVVVAQKLIPEYVNGDKRVLLINGEPVKHGLLRLPQPGKLRANMAAGGRAQLSDIDERDRAICAALAPTLATAGLLFVGIDIIGGYLTEINVTSPTGMREIDALSGSDIGSDVIRAIEVAHENQQAE